MSKQNTAFSIELQTIETVLKGLRKQIKVLENRKKEIEKEQNIEYKCEICDMTFDSSEKYHKHLNSKKHQEKAGIKLIKCSLCNNLFTSADLVAHSEDGRCVKSRTCKETGIVFANMMSKSRHAKKKKPKLKLVNKSVFEDTKDKPKNKPKDKPNKAQEPKMFKYDKAEYELQPLPDYVEEVDEEWYEELHEGIKESNQFYFQYTENLMYLANSVDQGDGLYLKDGIIYDKPDNDKLYKIKNVDNQFYELENIYVPKHQQLPEDTLLPLSTLKEEDNFDENKYANLHQNVELIGEYAQKYNDNINDIIDSKYEDGCYMYYYEGFLWRDNEKLFKFFKHDSGLFYDIEPCEIDLISIESDEDI